MYDTLYRGIKRSQPSFIRPDGRSVTSALFKDANGVSVDRKMERTEDEALEKMKKYFETRLKGIVSLSEMDVENVNAYLLPAPTKNNPYHAEIYKNCNKEMLSNLQQLRLADSCRLIFFDNEMAWSKVENPITSVAEG